MPKIKTKRGKKKRFKVTATGKILMFASGKRHNLTIRNKTMKRSSNKTWKSSRNTLKRLKRNE